MARNDPEDAYRDAIADMEEAYQEASQQDSVAGAAEVLEQAARCADSGGKVGTILDRLENDAEAQMGRRGNLQAVLHIHMTELALHAGRLDTCGQDRERLLMHLAEMHKAVSMNNQQEFTRKLESLRARLEG